MSSFVRSSGLITGLIRLSHAIYVIPPNVYFQAFEVVIILIVSFCMGFIMIEGRAGTLYMGLDLAESEVSNSTGGRRDCLVELVELGVYTDLALFVCLFGCLGRRSLCGRLGLVLLVVFLAFVLTCPLIIGTSLTTATVSVLGILLLFEISL